MRLCECYEFRIPKFTRYGTLDQLMSLSDDLIKFDSAVENISIKILRQLVESQGEIDYTPEIIMQEENTAPVELYLNFFQWDENQYLITKTLKELTDQIFKKANKFDDELKIKTTEFTTLKSNIQLLDRKRTGPLTTRALDGIVQKDHILDTEYLQTLFVVVPKGQKSDWEKNYEDLHEFVVPGSSKLVYDKDPDFNLYNLIVMRKMANDVIEKCKHLKYFPRNDFTFDETRAQLSNLEKEKMKEKLDTTKKEMFEWCKTAFSECFSAWVHLKAIRTFAESVLRYGLPPKFVSLLLKVSKTEKKVHKFFTDHYKHLQEDYPTVADEQALSSVAQYGDFYPYVLIVLNTEPFFKSS